MNRFNEAALIPARADGGPANIGIFNTRYGLMMLQAHDKIIGLSLRAYGEWAQHEVDFLLSFLGPGMVIVDAGANIGAHTLAFASKVGPTGHVIAFEPEPTTYHMLAGNVVLNELRHVTTFNAMLGPVQGYGRVQRYDPDHDGNFGAVHSSVGAVHTGDLPKGTTMQIRMMRVDDLNLETCHLIKADVEGAELGVLRGATETIRQCHPVLYLEANDAERTHDVIEFLLDELGYAVHWYVTPAFNPNNFNGNKLELWPHAAAEFALVCTPPGMPAEGLIPCAGHGDDHEKLTRRMTVNDTARTVI